MMKTRIASLALASIMALGCTGITAFATEVEDAPATETIVDGTIVDDTITDDTITDDTITDDTITDDTATSKTPNKEMIKPVHEKSPDFEKELTKTASSWSVDSLKAAVELGIVPEKLQDDFQSTNSRAEFCALAVGLYETMMGEEITTLMTFSDTDDINVQKMAGLGVVNGYGDGTFQPETGLNREQAAVILTRLAEVMGYPLDMADADFSDLDKASDWAVDPIGQVQNAEIMSGYGNGQFMPKGLYSREQSIVTVLRLFDMMYVAE